MNTEIEAGRYDCPLGCAERFETIGDKKRHMRLEHAPDDPI